jgi:hypothetical protein
MRTTLTIDDDLAKALRRLSGDSGRPFKEVVNHALRAGLEVKQNLCKARPYRLSPVSLGGVRPGIDLDKTLGLSDELESRELARKLRLRK